MATEPLVLRWLTRLSAGMIRFYQRAISPYLGNNCRYRPTCSQYALEALQIHGLIRGWGLALWRLLRCHPFARGGDDPVPPARQ
ncbi:MAG: membrane protein insertion efficiency factor YidD [Myxococcales bacterium]|nr:membrane protein insertion efficiency factor YidD [Myxococcales bacterium]